MKKYLTIFFVFLLAVNFSFALTQLPKTSYLQYLDNSFDVQTLQQILNADPDTAVAPDGPGSPGQEVSFFGALTQDAVKRFQQKYNLTVTGKVDYKTLRQLNLVVSNGPANSQSINTYPATSSAQTITTDNNISTNNIIDNNSDIQNPYLDSSDPNPYFDSPTVQNLQTQTATPTSLTQTLLNAILNKYSSLFGLTPANITTQPVSTNPYLPTQSTANQNPYLSPSTNSASPFGSGASPYGSNGANGANGQNGGFMGTLSNLIGGAAGPQSPYSGPPLDGQRWSGSGNGDGFGEVLTTVYGHERNGSSDREDNGQPFCERSCSTRKGGKCEKAVSLKQSVATKIFGPGRAFCGKEIEIVYPKKNTCGVYVLYERGPAENLTQSMDLTGTTWNELDPGGNSGKEMMRFRILKPGDQACQGYRRVDGKTS